MTCPSTAPESETACTLDDTGEAHVHGHSAPTPGGDGVTVWGVTLEDHARWGTETPPAELLVWEADARAAEQDAEEEGPADLPEPLVWEANEPVLEATE
jgi:hypothetical protein